MKRFVHHGAVIVLVLAACLLGGCDLGPDYRRPDTPVAAAWLGASGQGAWPSPDWWKSFGSSQLDLLIGQAQQANPDLGAAIARVQQADAEVRIAGAPLLPSAQLDANASEQRALQLGQYSRFKDFVVEPTASYELDFWGKNRARLESAQALARGSRYDQQVVALTVTSSVANAYFQILALRARIVVAESNLAAARAVLQGVVARQREGYGTVLDVVQQETTVAEAVAAVPVLQRQLQQDLDALAILTGELPEALRLSPESFDSILFPEVTPDLPSGLLQRRPDVNEAEAQLVAANANIKVARAQFFPDITLTAAGGFESNALANLIEPGHGIFDLAASLTQPIFEGGALIGQLHLNQARYNELVQDYRKSVLSAFSDVENALAATTRTAEQLADQETTVRLARRSFEIAQVEYRVGTVTLLNVFTAENALFPAEDSLVQDRLAHLLALVSLYQALGGGWQAK